MAFSNLLIFLARIVAFLVAFAFWMTFGLALWMLRLTRVVVAYSFHAMLLPFTTYDLSKSERALRATVDFWPHGVKRLFRIFEAERVVQSEPVRWSDVLPGVAKDGLYAAMLAVVALGFHHGMNSNPDAAVADVPSALAKPLTQSNAAGVSTDRKIVEEQSVASVNEAGQPDLDNRSQGDESSSPHMQWSAVVVHQEKPVYPRSEINRGIEGEAVVLVTVTADGTVSSAVIDQSSGSHRLDDAAAVAARRWRFAPDASINGRPQAVRIPFKFTLL